LRLTDGRVSSSPLMKRFILVFFALSLLPYVAATKRVAPAKVEPVIHEGIRYVAPNDDGRRAYIEAWDVQTNKKVWELTVFTNPIDLNLEEDVQWFFIDGLSIRDGRLMVKSEGGQMYEVDLKTKAITRFDSVAASPEVSREIPKTVKKAIANGSLTKDYDISFQMEPFYLQADFNGDRKVDVAVLVRQRSTGKFGIAIIHGGMSRAAILGAGISIGNGGDDFE
jgi:hypothetical protein